MKVILKKELQPLYYSMRSHKKDMEQFNVRYNKINFRVIWDIGCTPFELMIAAVGTSTHWGTVVKIFNGFEAEMNDKDFFALCDLLDLRPGKGVFTSFIFLKMIASHAPSEVSANMVKPSYINLFRKDKIPKSEEPEKDIFVGWNDHVKDRRKAQNFKKTELLLGAECAAYCRKHNISSMWTDDPAKIKDLAYPWD